MMNLSAFCPYLIRYHHKLILLISFLIVTITFHPVIVQAQDLSTDTNQRRDTIPEPSTVWKKSAFLPGWGQSINGQHWKIPIIYASLAGLSYYSMTQHNEYNDYRAAYYNTISNNSDQKFGPTRSDLENLPPELLRYNRNTLRNRRDLGILMVVAAWGLNVVDAYVFAQLKDFDTGPDLSFSPSYNHQMISGNAGYTLDIKIKFPLKRK